MKTGRFVHYASGPMKALRRAALAALAMLVFASCGDLPATTEQARGVLEGPNLVLALSVLFIVVSGGLIVAAIGVDRFFRSRGQLAEDDTEETEEADEVVAGITVGRAAVPRWLYGAYVLIPVFAFAYVFSNIAPPPSAEPEPTEAPSGPCTECEIVSIGIAWDLKELVVPADTDVTVTLDNQDAGIPHNWTLWETQADSTGGGEPIAETATFNGVASRTVTFNSNGAGSYFYNCTVHPAMVGTLVVE